MTRRMAVCATVIVIGFGGIWITPIWGAFRDDTHNPGNRFRVGEFAAPVVTATASAIATASEVVCDLGPLATACPTTPPPSPGATDPSPAPSPAAGPEPEPQPESQPQPELESEPEPEPVAEPEHEPPATATAVEVENSQTRQPGEGEPSA